MKEKFVSRRDKVDFVTSSYSCIREAQRLMQKYILNADLFNVLNKDSAMESLLGHAVAPSDFDDATECAKLRAEMTTKLEESMFNASGNIRASLEGYVTDLTSTIQAYDARQEADSRLRQSFYKIAATLSDEDKKKFGELVVDALCYTYTNAEEVLNELENVSSFISTECDCENLKSIASTNGSQMSEDQKKYLDDLEAKICNTPFVKDDLFDIMMDDRLVGMTVEALGFTIDNLVKLLKRADKVYPKFIKSVRILKEAIIRPDATTESLAVVNCKFFDLMDKFAHFVWDGSKSLHYITEQTSLMISPLVAQPPKNKERSEEILDAQTPKSKDRSEEIEEANTGDGTIQTNQPGDEPIVTD